MNSNLLSSWIGLSLRRMARHKGHTLILVFGLAIGFAAVFLVMGYVDFERSYDRFHEHSDRVYRVVTEWNNNTNGSDHRATTVPWSGPGAKEAFAEVEAFTRLMPLSRMTGDNVVTYNDQPLDGADIFLADSGFFKVFSFPLFAGDAQTALKEPGSIIISSAVAEKYFGNANPVGLSVRVDTHGNLSTSDFKITGVIAEVPVNSHIRFDFLISYSSEWASLNSGSTWWHWDNTYCYLLLQPGADPAALAKKISEQRLKLFGAELGEWKDDIQFRLQPLSEIHLSSSLKGEPSINGNGLYLDFLAVLGYCILISACINYVNLTMAHVFRRRTEIGVRKVSGSSAGQIFIQMAVEALVVGVLALLLSFPLMDIISRSIAAIFNFVWPVSIYHVFLSPAMVPITIIFGICVLFSVLYPASLASRSRAAEILKANPVIGRQRWTLRKYLTVAQFASCLLSTIATWLLYQQLQFIRQHDLGMDMEAVIAVRGYGFQKNEVYDKFRQQLEGASWLRALGHSSAVPGDEITDLGLRPKVAVGNSDIYHEVKMVFADNGFFEVLNIQFAGGRNFDRPRLTDAHAVIVNEAAAALLEGKKNSSLVFSPLHGVSEKPVEIIGVIRNYHQRSLKNAYEPMIFLPSWTNQLGWDKKYFFIKVLPYDSPDIIASLREAWNNAAPGFPFTYFYLDSRFEKQYEADRLFAAMFLSFAVLSLGVIYVGLLGVVAGVTMQRTKEIGIRKVLGASVRNILTLLSWDSVRLLLFAAIMAVPPAIWIVHQWLNTFAFHVELTSTMYTVPVIAVFLLTVAVTLAGAIKGAVTNPVESIRHE